MSDTVMMANGIIKIPDFERNSEPSRWLRIYESNMDVAGVTDANKLKLIQGYIKSESHLDWFYDHIFANWQEFKEKFIERFQKSKVKINNVLSAILGIKKKSNESMRQYVDRFDHLVGVYNRQRKVKDDWNEINTTVLKDTFINGIKPVALRMLVKQHLPKTLTEAQLTAIKECEEEESESESEETASERAK